VSLGWEYVWLRNILEGLCGTNTFSLDLTASYFNFVNRIALGLGVTFTAEEAAGYHY
jgi:hypothetical protein